MTEQRVRDRAELAAHSMSDLVRSAAQAMRAGLQVGTGDGFEGLPALDRSPRRDQARGLDMDQPQIERDWQRERQRDIDIGFER